MTTIAFFDTKPYDRTYFERAAGADKIRWQGPRQIYINDPNSVK